MKIDELISKSVAGEIGEDPENLHVTGAAYIFQTTQFPKTTTKYYNYYTLLRVNDYFGACCHTKEQADLKIAEDLSGTKLSDALLDQRLNVRIAALDAYLGNIRPHKKCSRKTVTIPAGTAVDRANFRDKTIAEIANIKAGEKVALIGVVNPLVKAITDRGGICLPCDLDMKVTESGQMVEPDMEVVLSEADKVISTAMTLSNGTFDRIRQRAMERRIDLIIYGQTGSAVAAYYVGNGVSAVVAEPFPFSQFTTDDSNLYLYGAVNND